MRRLQGNLQYPWGWVAEVLGIRVVTIKKENKNKNKNKGKRKLPL
jgi:hypothetical protein